MSTDIFLDKCEREHIDKQQVESFMKLFDMHDLIPSMSAEGHAYANALAMLVTAFHWHGNNKNLFESLPYTQGREIDLLDILNTMANLGYVSHDMQIDLEDIDDRLMPCLYIPDSSSDEPLILLSKKEDTIVLFNGKTKNVIELECQSMQGSVYFFEKMSDEQIEENMQTKKAAGLTWFDTVFAKFRPILKKVVLASIFINIFALSMPLFIMSVYDRVIGSGSTDNLWAIVVGVMIAITTEGFLRILRLNAVVWMGVRLDNIVSNAIFEKLMLMRASFTEGASISSQISRIKSFESIRQFFTGPLFSVIIELPFTIILLMAIWFISGPLVFIPVIVATVFALLLFLYQSRVRVVMRASARSGSARQHHAMETFIKLHSLHHNGMAKSWWVKYKEKVSDAVLKSFDANFIAVITENFAHAVSMLSGVAVITFGVQLIWSGTITVGALVATMLLIWRVLGPMQTLCSMLPRLEQLKNSVAQINRLMNIEVEKKSSILKRPIEKMNGHVTLTNIGLRYSVETEPLFVGLDIDVKPGEVIAITGVNGAGKSSLLKIINGLYKPQTGTIKIDDQNIKQADPMELRNYIAYMPQAANFFEGSIKENIMLVNPLASADQLNKALVDSTANDEIDQLPDGINTKIYGNNPSLNNSFMHALNFARVLIKDSNLLLLDELPNSALSEKLGEAYRRTIAQCKERKKTVFFVSQRDDCLKLADRIIVLNLNKQPTIMGASDFLNKYGQK
ncbi:MAG: hypothetical protein DGJ47_000281 [Rickettsiaceae bacterium]